MNNGESGSGPAHAGRGGRGEAVLRLVVSVDACGSGQLGPEAKQRLRAALYEVFAEACESAGVLSGELYQEDRGDGILAALDPAVPPSAMVGRWVDTLYEGVRERNRGAAVPLRLRVAMHAGPVAHDGRGLVGRAVDLTCRLCDSETARHVIAAAGADLLLVVSDWLYANVVQEGGRYIEPDHYRPARVSHKETDTVAWFHVPRLPEPPAPAAPAAPAAPTRPAPASGTAPEPPGERARNTFHVAGDSQVFSGNVMRGGFTGIRKVPPRFPPAGDGGVAE